MKEYKNCRELVDAWFQGMAADRCQGKLWKGKANKSQTVTTSQPAPLNYCSPKTSLMVSCSPDISYLIYWDKLLPQQIPLPLSVQSFAWLFVTPWTAACQSSLSITNSWSLLKLMSIESVMLSNHFIFSCPLLLLPSALPSIKVFSNESVLHIRWPQSIVTSASESVLPMNIQGLFPWGLTYIYLPGGSVVKNLPTNAGDAGSTPASGRYPGEGNSYPSQNSCLENSMDRGTWQATVHGVTKNQAWPSNWAHTHTRIFCKICISWKKEKNLSASRLLRGWVLFTSNLAKTRRWSCGRSENTGESVLQGKVNTPASHLSKDTWQLTSGNTRTGWKEEKTIHLQILLGKVIWKPMSQKEQAYVNKGRNCILDSFIIAVYSKSHPQPPRSSQYLPLNIPGNKMNQQSLSSLPD